MKKNELLVLGKEWNSQAVPWPFSKTARHFEQTTRSVPCILKRKLFNFRPEENVSIYREYEGVGKSFAYFHGLRLPLAYEKAHQMAAFYGDFRSEEVTWFGRQARVPAVVLGARFADYSAGQEIFTVVSPQSRFRIALSNGGKDVRIRATVQEDGYESQILGRHGLLRSKTKRPVSDRGPPYEINVVIRSFGISRLLILLSDLGRAG